MKRTKNSRRMHMIFIVQSGIVEVCVYNNEFTVREQGGWQVPRGTLHFFYHRSLLSFIFPNMGGSVVDLSRHLSLPPTYALVVTYSIPYFSCLCTTAVA
jgi:hypothetical protein